MDLLSCSVRVYLVYLCFDLLVGSRIPSLKNVYLVCVYIMVLAVGSNSGFLSKMTTGCTSLSGTAHSFRGRASCVDTQKETETEKH